jgi:hypothetical protein
MEFLVLLLILGLAIHQFWVGHKKDQAGDVKAGRLHMFLSIILTVVGVLVLDALK